ncbi:MAG TPA: hypothetical protein VFN35_23700 [Ktedonobacteraceae bacterium]|nr:hypothetical protein [Ktedonobacteraceae bacterium]
MIGWIGILALGAALAGIFVLISWQASYLGAILASSLLLISGVTFPLETLPGWAASIGQVLPSTLWIEVIRRILADTTFSSAFVHISTESLFLRFLISMAVVCIFSIPCLAWSHRQLIKHGRVEVRTGA